MTSSGWVYHIKEGAADGGVPVLLPRFMVLRERSIALYLQDPSDTPKEKPLRSGVVGPRQQVVDHGRQTFSNGRVLHVFGISDKLEPSKEGRLGCLGADAAQSWIAAFQHAQEEAARSKQTGGGAPGSNQEDAGSGAAGGNGYLSAWWAGSNTEEAPKPYPRSESERHSSWLPLSLNPLTHMRRHSHSHSRRSDSQMLAAVNGGDALDSSEWRLFKVANGLRFFEDVNANLEEKDLVMVKAEGVVPASPDAVFELLLDTDYDLRSQWDPLSSSSEVIQAVDGHSDIVYTRIHSKYLKQWQRDRDIIFTRYWRRDPDGSFSIHLFPANHISKPLLPDTVRIDSSPGSWEILPLPSQHPHGMPRALVRHVLELTAEGWAKWRPTYFADFEDTVPYQALMRIAGLREYFNAHSAHTPESEFMASSGELAQMAASPDVGPEDHAKLSKMSPAGEGGVPPGEEEFFDAITSSVAEPDEALHAAKTGDGQSLEVRPSVPAKQGLQQSLSIKRSQVPQPGAVGDLDGAVEPIVLDKGQLQGTLKEGLSEGDTSCWSEPQGDQFKVRGHTYIKDHIKIPAGKPLLHLVAVDWLKSDGRIDHICSQKGYLAQSDAGKKLPFLLAFNLQVPGRPNYSQVFYFAADRPIRNGTLLSRFANDASFRNARLKLIPRVVHGYWAVKRAVGTKACLLGKALTCGYIRQDNYLEIDVDIGSSSVARGIIGVVIGYVTSLIVDLAVLVEGESEDELPEYLLGIMRVTKLKLEDAQPVPTHT